MGVKLATKTLLTSTALATSLIISGCATKLNFQDSSLLPFINVDDTPYIQNVCPQLQNIKLKTSNIKDVPHLDINEKAIFSLKGPLDNRDDLNRALYTNASIFTGDITSPLKDIQNSAPDLPSIFYINSSGGKTSIFRELTQAFKSRNAPNFTYGTRVAASSGFHILTKGTWRFVNHDTLLATHPSKAFIHETEDFALTGSDIPVLSTIFNFENLMLKLTLTYLNRQNIQSLEQLSKTNITYKCASSLFYNDADTFMPPNSALRLGFVDAVINKDDGTITYREKEIKPLPEGLPFKPPFVVTSPPSR